MSPSPQATATNLVTAASSVSGFSDPISAGRTIPDAVPLSTAAPLETQPSSVQSAEASPPQAAKARDWRLHKHADYQRVYQASRKQFASLLTWFVAPQPPERTDLGPRGSAGLHPPPRVGITAGKVLGKAVERNRIKRRMRAAITANLDALPDGVDVVLHPKRAVLTADWTALRNEVRRVFVKIKEGHTRSAPEERSPKERSTERKSREQQVREQPSRKRRLPVQKSREQDLPEQPS